MAINTNAEQVNIGQRNYRNAGADRDSEQLTQLLRGLQGMGDVIVQGQQNKDLQKQASESALKNLLAKADRNQADAQTNLATSQDVLNSNPKLSGVKIGENGDVSLAAKDNSFQRMKFDQTQQNKAGGDYDKLTGFDSALKDVNAMTNKDGKGGILTNPDAKLISTGMIASKVPTGALGVGELLGVVPPGSAEERKALDRLQLEYQRAMTGARTSDAMATREKNAMGYMASGDPDLVAKGVRSLARNIQEHYNSVNSKYSPDTLDAVQAVTGNPMDLYGKIYNDFGDKPAPASPAAPAAVAPQASPLASPSAMPSSPALAAPSSPVQGAAPSSPVNPFTAERLRREALKKKSGE